MALKDRPIQGGSLTPVVIAGYENGGGEVAPSSPLTITESWRVTHLQDASANDSDKTFTVPADQEWQILWIYITLATSADVGNRQIVVVAPGDSTVVAGSVQAASLTRYYLFAPSLADLTDFRDTNYLMTPIPPTFFLAPGETIRVWDNNAVAAGADDMTVYIQYAWRNV